MNKVIKNPGRVIMKRTEKKEMKTKSPVKELKQETKDQLEYLGLDLDDLPA